MLVTAELTPEQENLLIDQTRIFLTDKVSNLIDNNIDLNDTIKDQVYTILGEPNYSRHFDQAIEDGVANYIEHSCEISDATICNAISNKVDDRIDESNITYSIDIAVSNLDLAEIAGSKIQETLNQIDINQFTKDALSDISHDKIEELLKVRSLDDRFNECIKEWIKQCIPLKFIEYVAEGSIKEDVNLKIKTPVSTRPEQKDSTVEIRSNFIDANVNAVYLIPRSQFLSVTKILEILGGKQICQTQ